MAELRQAGTAQIRQSVTVLADGTVAYNAEAVFPDGATYLGRGHTPDKALARLHQTLAQGTHSSGSASTRIAGSPA